MQKRYRNKRLLVTGTLIFVVCALLLWRGSLNTNTKSDKTATMEELFQVALAPVGNTMYVWGGGWNTESEAAGDGATQLGVSPKWAEFASMQDETYDYKEHRFELENGLDCSGYVGWVMYNLFEEEEGKEGYVTLSTQMAADFATRGWGKLIKNPHKLLPGDIVSMEGHVWISLGTCADGSVLLVHSSPPGVSVCGTPVPKNMKNQDLQNEEHESIAIQLAKKYMSERYPDWQKKYPNRAVSDAYLEDIAVFRWSEKKLLDAKRYQSLSGEEIIDLL